MEMFFYLVLAAVLYGILADRSDKAVDQKMRERRHGSSHVRLLQDFNVRPGLGLRAPRVGRVAERRAEDNT